MSGGKIEKLGWKKSAFIEFFFKPAIISAALFAEAWLKWASPPRSEQNLKILQASDAAVKKIWQNSPIMAWKMRLFAFIVASFCEADNAYETFFYEFVNELNSRWKQ